MIDPATWLAFVATTGVLVLIPGPDTMLVLGCSALDGPRRGALAALGTTIGNVGHAVLAALGITAVIAASPALFDAMRVTGAAYLAWLGFRALRAGWRAWRRGDGVALALPASAPQDVMVRAIMTNLLNPKVILFYFALVPQFVGPGASPVWAQTLILGLSVAAMGWLYLTLLALSAGSAAQRLLTTRMGRAVLDLGSGMVFLGFALRLLVTERRGA